MCQSHIPFVVGLYEYSVIPSNVFCLPIPPLMDTWIVSTFGLLQIML